jgi:hypothetical protein
MDAQYGSSMATDITFGDFFVTLDGAGSGRKSPGNDLWGTSCRIDQ